MISPKGRSAVHARVFMCPCREIVIVSSSVCGMGGGRKYGRAGRVEVVCVMWTRSTTQFGLAKCWMILKAMRDESASWCVWDVLTSRDVNTYHTSICLGILVVLLKGTWSTNERFFDGRKFLAECWVLLEKCHRHLQCTWRLFSAKFDSVWMFRTLAFLRSKKCQLLIVSWSRIV